MRARPLLAAPIFALAAFLAAACGQAQLSTTAPDTPKCQVTVDGAVPAAPADGATGTLTVTTTRDCTWTATSSANWIELPGARSGQGSGTVAYKIDANGQPAARGGTIDVNGSQATVSQAPAPCKFAVSPANAAVSASGGAVTIAVETLTGCSWTAAADDPWVHVISGASGNGAGTIRFAVDANAGGARSCLAHVANQTVTIDQAEQPQSQPTPAPAPAPAPAPSPAPAPAPPPSPTPSPAPAPCHYSLAATTQSVAASGGSNTVQVIADSGCAWTATSNASWLTITRGASGSGSGAVTYSATANTGDARTGTLTIAGQTMTVTQAAAPPPPPPPCSDSISPTSQTVDYTGGNGTVAITAGSGCAWTATSNASWITITQGASGTGNGSVSFTVASNSGGARSGTLTIAGQTFTVNQAAAPPPPPPPPPCSYSIAPTSQSVDYPGGSGTVAVTTGSSCTWTAASNASWITITSGASGTGNGSVAFTVASNSGGARSGTLTIAGQTFTVNQAAAPPPPPCSYSISPTSQAVVVGGASGTVAVTTGSSCTWTATSNNADWITITSGASGTGNGSVGYSVAPNGTGQPRSGTATIAGQTFTVNQSGS